MAKSYELVRLYRNRSGMWVASLYNRESGCFHEQRFLWYSKKDVVFKLRHDFGVKVSRDVCRGDLAPHGYTKTFWKEITT